MIKNARLFYVTTDYFNSILLVFLPLFLKTFYHYDGNVFGTILFIAGLFAIGGIILGYLLVNKLKNEKDALIIEFLIMSGAILMLLFFNNIIIVSIAVGLCYLNRMAMYTIGDNMMVEIANANNLAFGKFRSFGSIGWGLSFLINGFLVMNAPYLFLIIWYIVCILAIVNLFLLPNIKKVIALKEKISLKELLLYPNAIKYLIIAIIIYVLIYSVPPFLNFRILELKGQVEVYSFITAILVIGEFLMIFFANEFRKRTKDKYYIMSIGLCLSLKMLVIFISNNPIIIYATAILDPIIFGLILPFNPAYLKVSTSVRLNGLVLNIFGVMSLLFIALCSKFSSSIMDVINLKFLFMVYLLMALLVIVLPLLFKLDNYSQKEF
ncbi:MAG: MFS transporter [Bacilli bacterium]|jgi:PPP family 3-phenylpropionic acid transporter|nr:MFS transporter [Bacilli bacterium]